MLRMSACILTILAGMSFGNAALAQRTGASIDAGALNMRYADSIKANALALTPAVWIEYPLATFSAVGTVSQFDEGGWSAQGTADGSRFTRRYSLFAGELEGTAGGSTHRDGARTGQLLASARAHLMNDYRGAWIGGGAGSAYDGASWRSVIQGEAAAWARFDAATVFASITPVSVADSIRYTDAELSASINLPVVELVATGGARSGATSKSWGSASVTAWVSRRIAIVGSAGTYPIDLTQGFPGGRFLSLSLRVGTRRFPPATSSVREIEDITVKSRSPLRLETRSLGRGLHEIRFHASRAEAVDVMGDFTNWKPVRLENAGGGWWSASFPIAAGIHELNVRIGGGPWIAPPGVPAKSDEFGGSVGILIIP
jgi:hypothetical protein